MDNVLQLSTEDLIVINPCATRSRSSLTYQCCKFGHMMQVYILYLVLIFKNKNVFHNLIFYLPYVVFYFYLYLILKKNNL